MHKIGFIGGGKIAQAMAKGFIKAGMLNLTNKSTQRFSITQSGPLIASLQSATFSICLNDEAIQFSDIYQLITQDFHVILLLFLLLFIKKV